MDCDANGVPDECVGGITGVCTTATQSGAISDSATTGGQSAQDTSLTVTQVEVVVDVNFQVASLQIEEGGVVNVTGETVGNLTVTEAGGIQVEGQLLVANDRTIDASSGTVAIDAGGNYGPAPGATDTSVTLLASNVTISAGTVPPAGITAGTSPLPGGHMTLTDAMSVTTGTLLMDGSTVPLQCGGSVASVQGVSPLPKLEITKSATLSATQIVLAHSTDVTVGSPDPQVTEEPTITVTGAFRNKSKDPCRFNWYSGRLVLGRTMVGASGGLRVAGTEPTTLEVAGQDLGAVADGFNTGADGNFSISTLEIAPGRT